MKRIKSLLTRSNGQAMAEYVLIVTIIALGCMAAFRLFGQAVAQRIPALIN